MSPNRAGQRGQTLPMFALMLTVLIGAAGLAVDVGGAWSQRRTQQNVADTAALAAATAQANNLSRAEIVAAAISSGVANGYLASEITVNIPPTSGPNSPAAGGSTNDCSTQASRPCWIEVVVARQHDNTFARVLGQPEWGVSARAVAVGGIANTVMNGLAPLQFNFAQVQAANRGTDKMYCSPQNVGCPPNDPHETWPKSDAVNPQFAWTQFCLAHENCNVDAATAKDIVEAGNYQVTVTLNMSLGPHNGGGMDSVCRALKLQYPSGGDMPVAINDDDGQLVGFWMWHFDAPNTDCTGGMELWGYFVDDLTSSLPITITNGGGNAIFGQPVVRLVE